MNYFFLIFFSSLTIACNEKQNKSHKSSFNQNLENITDTANKQPTTTKCSFLDIIQLRENAKMQRSLFEQINNWKKVYDKNNEFLDDSIFVSLDEQKLIDFLKNLKSEHTGQINYFEKDYEFNSNPSQYKNNSKCKDHIKLTFDEKECSYLLTVQNCFYVEDFGCSEHDVFYIFKIINGSVKLENITGAG